MLGLENVYKAHHKNRGDGFAILQNERGEFLRQYIGTNKTVLDIGCRDGQLTSTYSKGNTVTGVDVDSHALALAKEKLGIEVIHTDLNADWDFKASSFDAVVACEFIEHIYFPSVVFKKVSVVLKPGGLFVGSIPHAYSLQSRIKFLLGIKKGTPLEDPTHINHFTYNEFKHILEEHFDVIEIRPYIPPRYRFLYPLFKYTFASGLLFSARKK